MDQTTSAPAVPFKGASALIFGGGQNIGRAIALEWARRGARVTVADRNAAGARETAAAIEAAGGEALGIGADVTDDGAVNGAVAVAEGRFGPLDILMNNAGILSGGNPEDIPVRAWQEIMDVNFFGMIRAIEAALPGMLARGRGHVVNTASFAGMYPFATSRIHYASSKAAVLAMSENLALYCMPQGVRVSVLCPGPVMTTVTDGMKHWSENYTMRMPGSHLTLKSQAETATVLSDGMEAGRIVIPTDELVWATLRERAAGPDAFIVKKNAEFEAGDNGRPMVPAEFLKG